MATQDGERLRQLVGDYYHGLITPDSYREQRAVLLDNIGAEIEEQSETTTDSLQPSQEKEPLTSAPAPTGPYMRVASFGRKRLVIGTVVLAGLAAGTYMIFVQGIGTGPATNATANQSEIVEERSSDFGESLVEEFLNRNDWMEDSLKNFLLAWGALDDGQRQRATDGRPYRRLTTALHQRIREETALGGAPDSGQLETLMTFATAMGSPYREYRAPSVDQTAGTEAPSIVDAPDVAEVVSANGDVTMATSSEDATAVPEFAQAASAPVDEPEQAIDDVLVDPVTEPSATTDTTAIAEDPCPSRIAKTRQPYCQDTLSNGSKGPPLVVLPTGSYGMGNGEIESESPVHQVDIVDHIAMSRYEVSAQEYELFCAATSLPCADSPWGRDYPVVSVNWDDAILYTEWLSETTGFEYRLPSEAEWEFAARAGTQSPYYFGDEITPSSARSSVNGAADSPLPRTDRTTNRNPFKLYHMSGNVREWTQDTWLPNYDGAPGDGSARQHETENRRVVRGGSYSDPGSKLRSAARELLNRSHRDAMTGFRVVRVVLQQATDN